MKMEKVAGSFGEMYKKKFEKRKVIFVPHLG